MIYLVATPIGNLGDISQRALEVLRAADLIASEDTRHTGQLLKRFEIDTPQMSFHEHNERQAAEKKLSELESNFVDFKKSQEDRDKKMLAALGHGDDTDDHEAAAKKAVCERDAALKKARDALVRSEVISVACIQRLMSA